MNLENKYSLLLRQILDASGECLPKSAISQNKDLQEILTYLLTLDLIEYDTKKNAFYLTPEGYEEAEKVKAKGELSDSKKTQIKRKKRTRNALIKLLIGIPVLGFYIFYLINGIKVNPRLPDKIIINEKTRKQLEEEIKAKIDSIKKQNAETIDN